MPGIIVGVDESAPAEAALRWAVDHGAVTGEPVTAVLAWGFIDQHHAEPGAPFDPQYSEAMATKVLDDLVSRAVTDGSADAVQRLVVCDLPARALLEAAADASLLVVGARGMGGFKGLLLGSVSRRVLHDAPCPVVVVRDATPRQDGSVVVGVDGSPAAHRALTWAVDYARRRQLPVTALYAWHLPAGAIGIATWPDPAALAADAERFVRDQVAKVDTTELVAPVECRIAPGPAGAALVEAGTLANVVVVGSRGHGQFANIILGSVSDQVAHHAPSPVVVVP